MQAFNINMQLTKLKEVVKAFKFLHNQASAFKS